MKNKVFLSIVFLLGLSLGLIVKSEKTIIHNKAIIQKELIEKTKEDVSLESEDKVKPSKNVMIEPLKENKTDESNENTVDKSTIDKENLDFSMKMIEEHSCFSATCERSLRFQKEYGQMIYDHLLIDHNLSVSDKKIINRLVYFVFDAIREIIRNDYKEGVKTQSEADLISFLDKKRVNFNDSVLIQKLKEMNFDYIGYRLDNTNNKQDYWDFYIFLNDGRIVTKAEIVAESDAQRCFVKNIFWKNKKVDFTDYCENIVN